MQHFTDDNFQAEVVGSSMPVLVDFFAEWCGPCKMLSPIVEKLAKEYEGKFKMGKLDVDENPQVAGMFEIQSIPTLLFFKAGQPVEKIMGFKSEADLKKVIDRILG